MLVISLVLIDLGLDFEVHDYNFEVEDANEHISKNVPQSGLPDPVNRVARFTILLISMVLSTLGT